MVPIKIVESTAQALMSKDLSDVNGLIILFNGNDIGVDAALVDQMLTKINKEANALVTIWIKVASFDGDYNELMRLAANIKRLNTPVAKLNSTSFPSGIILHFQMQGINGDEGAKAIATALKTMPFNNGLHIALGDIKSQQVTSGGLALFADSMLSNTVVMSFAYMEGTKTHYSTMSSDKLPPVVSGIRTCTIRNKLLQRYPGYSGYIKQLCKDNGLYQPSKGSLRNPSLLKQAAMVAMYKYEASVLHHRIPKEVCDFELLLQLKNTISALKPKPLTLNACK